MSEEIKFLQSKGFVIPEDGKLLIVKDIHNKEYDEELTSLLKEYKETQSKKDSDAELIVILNNTLEILTRHNNRYTFDTPEFRARVKTLDKLDLLIDRIK